MVARVNRQILLKSRPEGVPSLDNFVLKQSSVPEPGDGEVLMRTRWLSLDPYMRGRMNAAKSYAKPVEVGATMVGGTVGEVVASRNPNLAVGRRRGCGRSFLYRRAAVGSRRRLGSADANRTRPDARPCHALCPRDLDNGRRSSRRHCRPQAACPGVASAAAVHDQAARPPMSSFSPRATIVSTSSGNGLCSFNASSGGAAIQVSNSSGFVRMTGMALG
jgi:hypothetical protein